MAAEPILRLKIKCLEGITNHRILIACFGAKSDVMADLWTRLNPRTIIPTGVKKAYILWAFHFLKLYNKEEVSTRNAGCPDNKHFKSGFGFLLMPFLLGISGGQLDFPILLLHFLFVSIPDASFFHKISPEEQYLGDLGNRPWLQLTVLICPCSTDSITIFSHKSKSNGSNYKVGFYIQKGNIDCINCPSYVTDFMILIFLVWQSLVNCMRRTWLRLMEFMQVNHSIVHPASRDT